MIQPEDKAFIFSFVFSARIRSRFHQQALPLETPTDIVANRLRLHIVTRNNMRNNSKQYGINSENNAVQSLQERNTINGQCNTVRYHNICDLICVFSSVEFKHALQTKKQLEHEGLMYAIARLIETQGSVGKQNECYPNDVTA